MTKIAIVILNWNGKNHLQLFLPSVIAYTPQEAEIIVADNASTDDSIAFLQKEFPQVKILRNPTNGGFAAGYNTALQHIKAEYYVLLNSDVEVTNGWIDAPIAAMEKDRQIAACQPKIKSFLNKAYFEHAGAAGGFIDKYGYAFCRGRVFEQVEKDNGQYDDECEIFWATGACMFIRSAAFHQAGGFDPDFFAHMEEIDLCWRLKRSGFKIIYIPTAEVYHLGGGTLNYLSPNKTFLNFRNSLFLLLKNLPPEKLLTVLLIRMVLDGIAAIKFLTQGGFNHFFAVLKAHFYFYRSFAKFYKKRQVNIGSKITSKIYLSSIVWQHFINGKKKFSQLSINYS
jgi:GT2 family glycosyltransferase